MLTVAVAAPTSSASYCTGLASCDCVICNWCGFAVVQSCGVCWASDSETVCWRVLVLCDMLLGVHGFCYDQWVTLVNHVCPQVSGLHAPAGSFVWSWVLEMSARGYRLDEQRIRVWLVMVAAASIPTLGPCTVGTFPGVWSWSLTSM